jgi:TolB-like protein
MEQIVHRILKFDRFTVDVTRGLVRTPDQELALRPKTFEVLRYLAENAGRLVPKSELCGAVWPKVFVSDNSLEQCIRELREALGDVDHALIKTMPRRGYLLDAAVETTAPSNSVAVSRSDGESTSPSAPPRLSLVVLPFQNLSGDPDQEYFADAIAEDLTIDLSRLSGTVVIALSTAFSYKNKPIDVRQVGRELGVRYVLEGAVRRHADGVGVKVELVDATNAATIWAERFDVDPGSLQRLQSEVTGRIAYALDAQLVLAETARAVAEGPGNLKAEDLIFRGRALINTTPTADNCAEARRLFELALQLNGQSADGFAYLAQTYIWDWLMGWTTEKEAVLELAEVNARRALTIDSRNVRAHWVQGAVYDQRRQFDQAIAAFDTALAYDPNSARSYSRRGYCMLMAGRPQDALADMERAIRLSPRDQHLGSWYWYAGLAHRWLGQHEQALAMFIKSVDANRRAHVFYPYLAAEYVAAGRVSEAQAVVAEYRKLLTGASIAYLRNRWDYRSEHPRYLAMMEEQLDALRQAGLPESDAACEA